MSKMANDATWEKVKNLKVEEFTTPCPTVVSSDLKLNKLELLMKKKDIRHVPVEENGTLVGIISERDIYFAYRLGDMNELCAGDIMHKDPYQVDPETKISEVAFHMSKNKYGSALVAHPGGELGIFTSIDALNALIEIVRGDILTREE